MNFDNEITDYSLREWSLLNVKNNDITVSKDEKDNIIEAVYKPIKAKVTIKLLNMNDRPIKDVLVEEAQIGDMYNPDNKAEVVDNYGRVWTCKDKGESIVISRKESQNIVSLRYEPLLSKVTVKYYSDEMTELLDPKYEMVQVGSKYKNSPITNITDFAGKRWIFDDSKVPSIVVKKHEEENIINIYLFY